MNNLLIIYIIALSVISFILMGIDKSRAKNNKWRISEKTLFTLAIVGGACGGLVGMYVFRHKTKHARFTFGFPLLAMIHIVIVYYVIS
ncbi:MAG: DUF1294 domain-containing protein [Lysinibacillus sp.]|nr:DUF1294 domain-containing protein [Lysinibacillus sp.]